MKLTDPDTRNNCKHSRNLFTIHLFNFMPRFTLLRLAKPRYAQTIKDCLALRKILMVFLKNVS